MRVFFGSSALPQQFPEERVLRFTKNQKKGTSESLAQLRCSRMSLYAVSGLRRPLSTTALAVVDDGNRFVDVMMRLMKMIQNARLQALRVRIVFFLAAISDGPIDQFA